MKKRNGRKVVERLSLAKRAAALADFVRSLRPLVPLFCVLAVIGAAVFGLERLRGYAAGLTPPPSALEVSLIDPPDWLLREQWGPRVLASVGTPATLSAEADAAGASVATLVADRLANSGWVKTVREVNFGHDGAIHVRCDYRRPVAMVRTRLQGETVYVPVDETGVRMPEVYERIDKHSGWLRIHGVRCDLPPVNTAFPGDDLKGALEVAQLIVAQGWDVDGQISVVDVNNFRGRDNRYHDYIVLWRPEGDTPIPWGSAIGEEIEEPSPSEKLANIAVLLKHASPQARINPSVLAGALVVAPPAGSEPTPATVRTADRANHRRGQR